MTRVPQFALKVEGKTILRSDNAESIIHEMACRLDAESEMASEGQCSSIAQRPFTNIVYIAGQIVDWMYQEIPTVQRTEMHLEGIRTDTGYDYPVRNVVIKIEGGSLSKLRTYIEQELAIREFMYHDVLFELLDVIYNDNPCLVLQIIPRPKIPLAKEGEHQGGMPFDIREAISEELRKSSHHTYTKTVIQRILSRHCKCEQIRHGINLVELALTQKEFSASELRASEMCLEYLSDTREGKSLLSMWRNRDAICTKWDRRDIPSRAFISQVYEWFGDIRTRQCHEMSQSYRELSRTSQTDNEQLEQTRISKQRN